MTKSPRVVLVVLDGFGERPQMDGNAIRLAKTPRLAKIYSDSSWTLIGASGNDVGLPEGQMGNSEVGHLNLGAGRIVYQDLTRINKALANDEFARNKVAQEAFAKARGHRLHLLGLVSDGVVHSHYRHLLALAEAAHAAGVKEIFVYVFTDGRDASPTGGADILRECEKELAKSGAQIVTIVGRYFAMDRDRRWDRTKKAWDAIVHGQGEQTTKSPADAV